MAITPSTTIMLVDLSIDPARHAEFDSFYHDFYIPEFLHAVPEVRTARRYAQINLLGKLDPAKARFLTIYELLSDDSIDNIEAAIARSAHREASDQFKIWKQNGLTYFDRAFYWQVHKYVRQSEDGCWNSRSLCTWRWRVKPEVSIAGAVSYLSGYANQLMNSLPSVIAHHTYLRLDSEPHNLLTVFEVSDEIPLPQLMQAINSEMPHCDRTSLRDWLAATLPDHDATSFNLIYSLLSKADAPK